MKGQHFSYAHTLISKTSVEWFAIADWEKKPAWYLHQINDIFLCFSDLLIGMKVDRTTEKDDLVQKQTRGQQVRRFVEKSKSNEQPRYTQRKQATDIGKPQGEQETRRTRDTKRRYNKT